MSAEYILEVKYDVKNIIRGAVAEAERLYPNGNFRAEVEVNDNLELVVSVYLDNVGGE